MGLARTVRLRQISRLAVVQFRFPVKPLQSQG